MTRTLVLDTYAAAPSEPGPPPLSGLHLLYNRVRYSASTYERHILKTSPRFILTRAWDIICTINIVRSGNNHFSLWAVLRDKQKFAVLFIVCWCVWFCASLNDWYLGTGCETEGLENCSKYVCVYSMFSLISTSWSVISMPAPQNWLIKDTEWSDSRKFMLISAPSAQPPFWDTISACLNIQISRYQRRKN